VTARHDGSHHAVSRRVTTSSAAAMVLAALLSACFTTSADFKDNAEEYIRSSVAEALEVEFTEVTCESPPSQDVGTTFTCTARDAADQVWEFENTIDGDNEYSVEVTRRPPT
jgi:hypothetical protein